MATKEIVQTYFDAVTRGGWEASIAEDFEFTNSNFDTTVFGKAAYIEAAGRFFRATTSVQ